MIKATLVVADRDNAVLNLIDLENCLRYVDEFVDTLSNRLLLLANGYGVVIPCADGQA